MGEAPGQVVGEVLGGRDHAPARIGEFDLPGVRQMLGQLPNELAVTCPEESLDRPLASSDEPHAGSSLTCDPHGGHLGRETETGQTRVRTISA